MSVERQHKRAHRVTVFAPGSRLPLTRQPDPRRGFAANAAFNIGLLGIGLFNTVPGRKAVGIASLPGLHRGRARSQFLKQRRIPALILHSIALEDDPPFILAVGVVRRQLAPFF